MAASTVKAFLKQLKDISENTLVSELKGNDKLTDDEAAYLRAIIAGVQNDLGDMPEDIWKKFNVEPYKSS